MVRPWTRGGSACPPRPADGNPPGAAESEPVGKERHGLPGPVWSSDPWGPQGPALIPAARTACRERRDGQLPLSVQPHWGAPQIVVVEHNTEGHQGCSMMSSFPLANTWLTAIIPRGERITALDWAGDIQAGLQ